MHRPLHPTRTIQVDADSLFAQLQNILLHKYDPLRKLWRILALCFECTAPGMRTWEDMTFILIHPDGLIPTV